MTKDRYLTPLAASLPPTVPFVGPETLERQRGAPFDARLGANESVFGPSPNAVEAMKREAAESWKYGDSTSHDLRNAIAEYHGVKPENVIVGGGIDGLLGNLVRLTVTDGTPVVTSDGAYPTFNYHVVGFGGALHKVPYTADHEDPDRLLAKAKEVGAKLLYLCNPDNPMGTWHAPETIARTIDALPEGTLMLLDEAYADFMPPGSRLPERADDPRVIRFRTFSKAHGLAGARVGYAIGHPDLIATFERVRDHFGMTRVSQAGALAAIGDNEWLSSVIGQVSDARIALTRIAEEAGLKAIPSATNFVAIDCGRDGAFAASLLKALEKNGVFVRMPGVEPLSRCIRVSCGRPEDTECFAQALRRSLAELDALRNQ
ncbi:pyridoxal phosphate-dependent aminotransferase [Pelagovum pacificum]|uniref:Pyridoxal phosphate-dependent aminotransferase n=1 Tax=Pelagovum pacificum TaxID=2588711 RepID=A0A5C5G7U6_9RHOB|nr:pyridoxal phosphate-dependent aminotransferase [Pelagovum pacificum]QQA41553.1 pyridoxal phosphate-dependent aminotransferase [Pelagovum pacificum]TNY30833.1 pyridoxal phosphate-dependent aminotransferase [Pelagovum pacificum]